MLSLIILFVLSSYVRPPVGPVSRALREQDRVLVPMKGGHLLSVHPAVADPACGDSAELETRNVELAGADALGKDLLDWRFYTWHERFHTAETLAFLLHALSAGGGVRTRDLCSVGFHSRKNKQQMNHINHSLTRLTHQPNASRKID